MAIADMVVVIVGLPLAAGAVLYGCMTVPPGSGSRWVVYLGGAVVATQFVWLPLADAWADYPLTTADQCMAIPVAAIGLKLVMEKVVPNLL